MRSILVIVRNLKKKDWGKKQENAVPSRNFTLDLHMNFFFVFRISRNMGGGKHSHDSIIRRA